MRLKWNKIGTRRGTAWIIFALLILSVISQASEVETMYVQAIKGVLRSQPLASSSEVVKLKRGDEVAIINKQGGWFEADFQKKRGWISKLFLSKAKPVGAADLNNRVKTNLEKASRRRASSYAVSASTRGLMSSERVNRGREMYRSDHMALEQLEQIKIPDAELEKFSSSAGLTLN